MSESVSLNGLFIDKVRESSFVSWEERLSGAGYDLHGEILFGRATSEEMAKSIAGNEHFM